MEELIQSLRLQLDRGCLFCFIIVVLMLMFMMVCVGLQYIHDKADQVL